MRPKMANNLVAVTARVLTWNDNNRCTSCYVSPSELRCALRKASDVDNDCLVIVEGLSDDYRNVLQEDLGIDPDFISAHVKRRSYCPIERQKATFSHLDYPGVVSAVGIDQKSLSRVPFCPTSHDGRGILFSRASIWTALTDASAKNKTKVILLDEPWGSEPSKGESFLSDESEQRGIFFFQQCLQCVLSGFSMTKSLDDTTKSIEMLINRQWVELLDLIDFSIAQDFIAPLMWQIHQSLEMNHESTRDKLGYTNSQERFFDRLLQRAARAGQVLSQFRPAIQARSSTAEHIAISSANLKPASSPAVVLDETYLDEKQPITSDEEDDLQANALGPVIPNPSNPAEVLSPADENQRSLERLSYLGGVLLPFSIVSGILSMNDDYSPTGPLFFIYWAATIPLTIIALVVIYADSIRKSEVWVEVASVAGAAGHPSSMFPGSSPEVVPISATPEYAGEGRVHGDLETGLQVPLPPVSSPMPGSQITETVTYSETIPAADPRMTHSDTALDAVDHVHDNHSVGNDGGAGQSGAPESTPVVGDRIGRDPRMAHNHPSRYHHASYSNGPGARKWKKQQLGWYGACKTLLGVQPWGKVKSGENDGQDHGVVQNEDIYYYGERPMNRRVYSASTSAQIRGRGRGPGGRRSTQRRANTTTM